MSTVLLISEMNLCLPSARLSAIIQHLDRRMKHAPESLRLATSLHSCRDSKHDVYILYILYAKISNNSFLPVTDKKQKEKRENTSLLQSTVNSNLLVHLKKRFL